MTNYLVSLRNRWRSHIETPICRYLKARQQYEAMKYFLDHPSRTWIAGAHSQRLTTGCEWTDYRLLHQMILKYQPQCVLELGCGISTYVIADALKENGHGHCWSFEEHARYANVTWARLPESYRKLVTLEVRPVSTGCYDTRYHGRRFDYTARQCFDFVFVDGPTEYVDGQKGICLDLFRVPLGSPCHVLVDGKRNSCEAYRNWWGCRTGRYHRILDVGIFTIRS